MNIGKFGQLIKDYIIPFALIGIPIYCNYFNLQLGSVPIRQVELDKFGALNPLTDLKLLGDSATLSINVQGQTIDNLYIAQARIINRGKNPIQPTEYIEPIAISVEKPWKIVAVANGVNTPVSLHFDWKRINDTKFEAAPALLNPNDLITTHIYLTRTQSDLLIDKSEKTPNIIWSTRIVNLSDFYTPTPLKMLTDMFGERWGISVELYGWSFIFTIGAALLSQSYYLRLLSNAGIFDRWGSRSTVWVLVTMMLSFSSSECIATYLFGNYQTRFIGINHWLNLPPIILSFLVIIYLIECPKLHRKSP